MRSSRGFAVLCLFPFLFGLAASHAHAGAPPAPAPSGNATEVAGADAAVSAAIPGETELDAILVSGPQPGPGLWKVRKGDHVMWVLGVVNPLPKRMEWDTSTVDRRIVNAERVLLLPTVKLDADIGFFGKLSLVPTLMKARRNPDGRTLQQVLPAEQYARWVPLKQRFIGRDRDVEEWRPIFAAFELYEKAIDKQGMTEREIVEDAVARTARRAKVPITQPVITLMITEPKKAVREFSQTALNDQECFRLTLDRLETDLQNMRARANAWAEGDVERLRALSNYRSQFKACTDAFSNLEMGRRAGFADLQQRMRDAWLGEAEKMLDAHASSVAVLPVTFLFGENNALDRLQQRGYVIESP